jgi:hypothetical protein
MRWQNWLKLIGIALLAWIMYTIDWERTIKVFIKLDPVYVIGYFGCFFAMMLTRVERLRLALSRLDHRLTFKDCYVAMLEPAFMGVVTPGKLGELTRVGYIHSHGVPMQEAICVVTIERLIDMLVLLVFGTGGMVYIFASAPYRFGSALVVALGLLLSYVAIRSFGFTFKLLQRYLGWLSRWEPSAWADYRQTLTTSFHLVMGRAAAPIFFLGLVCISLNFVQIFFLAKAFGFQADYLVVIFAYAVSTLISLLPISVGGLGTREAMYIMIMARGGILQEQALLFSLMDGVVMKFLGLFLLFVPLWVSRMHIPAKPGPYSD